MSKCVEVCRPQAACYYSAMEPLPRILVVDDDREIRALVAEYLDGNGFVSQAVADGNAMWAALAQRPVDLIVLDLTLPGDDGLALCASLRTKSACPVIMLTARGTALDRIVGLELGADDYLPKPFEPRELVARIRSVLRRVQASGTAREPKRIRFAQWVLDLTARHLVAADGVIVALSGAEFRLLKVFLEHANQVLSRDQLLDLTKGREIDSFDRSIDLQVSRLRQRLRDDARAQDIIKTVRSEGYVFAASVAFEA
jgi:two-component system OmpR family response regulator